MADMLHIAPQRRPTASKLVAHSWVNGKTASSAVGLQNVAQAPQVVVEEPRTSENGQDLGNLKETVAATFKAIATSPQVAHLGPVAMSELARRRFRDKANAERL